MTNNTDTLLQHIDHSASIPNWFFNSLDVKRKFLDSIREWTGTPWKHNMVQCGVGTDCIGLVVGVLRDCGLKLDAPPEYPADWMRRPETCRMLYRHLKQHALAREVPTEDVLCMGDLILYNTSIKCTHISMYVQHNRVFHTTVNNCARISSIDLRPSAELARIVFRVITP